MRVVGGTFKGRRLQTCRVKSLRPTSEKIREAIFNIIAPWLAGGSVLDLYAGTGGLGIEALSRGMDRAVFVEHNSAIVSVLKKNISSCHCEEQSEVIGLPVSKGLKILKFRKEKFALIFLDPPYNEQLAGETIYEIYESQLLNEDGLITVEHSSREVLEKGYGGIKMENQRKYGQSLVSFFSLNQ